MRAKKTKRQNELEQGKGTASLKQLKSKGGDRRWRQKVEAEGEDER